METVIFVGRCIVSSIHVTRIWQGFTRSFLLFLRLLLLPPFPYISMYPRRAYVASYLRCIYAISCVRSHQSDTAFLTFERRLRDLVSKKQNISTLHAYCICSGMQIRLNHSLHFLMLFEKYFCG